MRFDHFLYPQLSLSQDNWIVLDERQIYLQEKELLKDQKEIKKNTVQGVMPGFDSTDQEEQEEAMEEEDIVIGAEDWGTLNDDQINNFE